MTSATATPRDDDARRSEPDEDDTTGVYLALIRMPRPTRELLLAHGIPAARLDPALATLAEWGLVVLASHGAIEVPHPGESLARHALRLERRASAARASADGLARVYHEARAARLVGSDLGIEVLPDLEAVARASHDAIARTTETVRIFRGMTLRTRQVIDAPMASHGEPTIGVGGRVVEMLTVWDSAVLELPAVLPVMRARREGRETQRFLPLLPISGIVVDDHTCILEWTGKGDGAQGLVGTSVGAVAAGRALFDRFWQLATPGVTPGATAEGLQEISERDATIVRLMAAGVADASIARQTGISQRTVERRVRFVMDRLGARTRFQAAVQATRRGWI
jgi:DNA-binding CsgD family transcriptional regulator